MGRKGSRPFLRKIRSHPVCLHYWMREKRTSPKKTNTHTHTFVDPWSVPNNRKNTQKILFTSWTRDSRVPSPKIEASKMAKLPNPLWSIRIAWRAANPAHLAVERGG